MGKNISVAEINEIVADRRQRGISAEFEGQLTGGILQPILERLRRDDTLESARFATATSISTTAAVVS